MLRTKDKEYHQILVDSNNRNTLHSKYGAGWSYNDIITEILQQHETAVSIIGDCKHCRAKFKAAVQKIMILIKLKWVGPSFATQARPKATTERMTTPHRPQTADKIRSVIDGK